MTKNKEKCLLFNTFQWFGTIKIIDFPIVFCATEATITLIPFEKTGLPDRPVRVERAPVAINVATLAEIVSPTDFAVTAAAFFVAVGGPFNHRVRIWAHHDKALR